MIGQFKNKRIKIWSITMA